MHFYTIAKWYEWQLYFDRCLIAFICTDCIIILFIYTHDANFASICKALYRALWLLKYTHHGV